VQRRGAAGHLVGREHALAPGREQVDEQHAPAFGDLDELGEPGERLDGLPEVLALDVRSTTGLAVDGGLGHARRRSIPDVAHEQAGAVEPDLGERAGELALVEHVLGLLLPAPPGDLVERGLGAVDVPAPDQLGHLPEEERQQQRADVAPVHVGVGHDDDPPVAQLG
jgi:hypothetical protein